MIAASFFVSKFQPGIVLATITLLEGGCRWFCGLFPGSYVEADLEVLNVDLVMAENSELESMELYAIFRTFFFVLVDVFAFPARAFQRLCKRDHTSAPLRQMVMKAMMPHHDRTTFHNQSSSFVYRTSFVRRFFAGWQDVGKIHGLVLFSNMKSALDANASERGVQTGQMQVRFSKKCYLRDILPK